MNMIEFTRPLIIGLIISIGSMGYTVDVRAQSREARLLIEDLLSVQKNKGIRWFPRAASARTIAKDTSISPRNRVDVLKTVLREELENPCPIQKLIHGGYVIPTVYIQGQYIFALEDIGVKAIPHLKRHLEQLRLSVQHLSPSLGNDRAEKVVEFQHILCALGLLRDKEVFRDVLELLEDRRVDGFIRQRAARALGKLGNKAAIPALTRALKDDFIAHDDFLGQPTYFYPVRGAACSALEKFGLEVELDNKDNKWIYRVVR